jgi:hypothetical protein
MRAKGLTFSQLYYAKQRYHAPEMEYIAIRGNVLNQLNSQSAAMQIT